jgi:hypothetical protein
VLNLLDYVWFWVLTSGPITKNILSQISHQTQVISECYNTRTGEQIAMLTFPFLNLCQMSKMTTLSHNIHHEICVNQSCLSLILYFTKGIASKMLCNNIVYLTFQIFKVHHIFASFPWINIHVVEVWKWGWPMLWTTIIVRYVSQTWWRWPFWTVYCNKNFTCIFIQLMLFVNDPVM